MSLENISKLRMNNDKITIYLFDVPTNEDEDALISYMLFIYKKNIRVEQVEDINDFIEKLRLCRAYDVKPDSKEYVTFLKLLFKYLKDNENDMEVTDELSLLSKNYIEEAEKKIKKNKK